MTKKTILVEGGIEVPDHDEQIRQEERKRIFKEIERKSSRMNTNMYGISLSREDWQAIKHGERPEG